MQLIAKCLFLLITCLGTAMSYFVNNDSLTYLGLFEGPGSLLLPDFQSGGSDSVPSYGDPPSVGPHSIGLAVSMLNPSISNMETALYASQDEQQQQAHMKQQVDQQHNTSDVSSFSSNCLL